jgi:YesN/AraC family two-component response regulator
VLNQVLHIRFNDYVNGLRIQYLKQQVSAEKLKSLTLEGLASEGGFGNRATFIRAVKKATGQNPSQFFNTSEKWAEENPTESLQKEKNGLN